MSKVTHIIDADKAKGFVCYEKLKIEDYDAQYGETPASHNFVFDVLRKLMGQSLTVIDATIPIGAQNKAVKDLFRSIFSEQMEFISDMMLDQKLINEAANESALQAEDLPEPVSIEEALGVE